MNANTLTTTQAAALHILRRLTESGVSTAELAEDTVIGRLTAHTTFTVAEVWQAAEFLGCSLSDLLDGTVSA
jgi:hypothetical protein